MSQKNPSIAIVGISCLFPKADDLQSYWANIKNGVNAITPLPAGSHWNAADYFDADPKSPDRTYARSGGFLSPLDFNPMEFGIAPKDHEAVFEEFRQVGAADKKAEGTGLGLALARKFIELHGGKIWVKSQVGAGSTFTFTLPFQRPAGG